MKARIPLPSTESLTPEGRAVYDSVLSTRGNLDGPFLAWLHSPVLASRAEQLGAFCRYQTLFSPLQSELLILVTAAHFRCAGEWQIHAPLALASGLDPVCMEAIRTGTPPVWTSPRLDALHRFATELLRLNKVSQDAYSRAQTLFGNQGLVELVGIVGYYSFVALTLNAFDMQREDCGDPFSSPERTAQGLQR